ncbi:MAG: hypothetical protein GC191_09125 [Azospirillum sp.]|nr:hypothetical protein [Azospirillum sp.]
MAILLVKSLPEHRATGDTSMAVRIHDAIAAVAGAGRAPSRAQLDAGNYRKHHRKFQGLDVTIENPRGSLRSGIDRDGREWCVSMHNDYGYIRGSLGVDGDHVDCYVGPAADAAIAYVVHQRKAGDWEAYDEDKVMLGFASEDEARAAYLLQYDDPRFLGPITAMPMAEFKAKVLATRDRPQMIKAFPLNRTIKVGDRIEFDDDVWTDKGPASGTVRSVSPDHKSITVDFGDGAEDEIDTIDWSRAKGFADWRNQRMSKGNKPYWLVGHGRPMAKALVLFLKANPPS